MTPLKTTRAKEIRATLLRAAEIALDPEYSDRYDGPLSVIWLASYAAMQEPTVQHYSATVTWPYFDRQRNCWALLFAAAAVED